MVLIRQHRQALPEIVFLRDTADIRKPRNWMELMISLYKVSKSLQSISKIKSRNLDKWIKIWIHN